MPKPLQLAAKVPEVDPNLGYFKKPDPQVVDHSSVGNRFGFQGRPRDPETGFVYFRNRYYDPELGRFITTDPLGYAGGPNLYQYGLNNPVDYSDPIGLLVGVPQAPALFTEATLQSLAIAANPDVPSAIRLHYLGSALENGELALGEQTVLAVINFPARVDRATDAAATDFAMAGVVEKDRLERTRLTSRGIGRVLLSLADGLTLAIPAANASASPVLRTLGNLGRGLNPFAWFDDLGEVTAQGFQQALSEAVPEIAPRVQSVPGGVQAAVRFDPSRAGHIFREAAGHVNPASAGSQARFARLFENVASNPTNLRADAVQAGLITQQAAEAGLQAFTWTGSSGQVWVTVRNGIIQNAGVNPVGGFR